MCVPLVGGVNFIVSAILAVSARCEEILAYSTNLEPWDDRQLRGHQQRRIQVGGHC
jgi:hypothetical protein